MDPARTARVAAAMKIWDLVEGIVVMVVVDFGVFRLRKYEMCRKVGQ